MLRIGVLSTNDSGQRPPLLPLQRRLENFVTLAAIAGNGDGVVSVLELKAATLVRRFGRKKMGVASLNSHYALSLNYLPSGQKNA